MRAVVIYNPLHNCIGTLATGYLNNKFLCIELQYIMMIMSFINDVYKLHKEYNYSETEI